MPSLRLPPTISGENLLDNDFHFRHDLRNGRLPLPGCARERRSRGNREWRHHPKESHPGVWCRRRLRRLPRVDSRHHRRAPLGGTSLCELPERRHVRRIRRNPGLGGREADRARARGAGSASSRRRVSGQPGRSSCRNGFGASPRGEAERLRPAGSGERWRRRGLFALVRKDALARGVLLREHRQHLVDAVA